MCYWKWTHKVNLGFNFMLAWYNDKQKRCTELGPSQKAHSQISMALSVLSQDESEKQGRFAKRR